MPSPLLRIGVLAGSGDCPGLNVALGVSNVAAALLPNEHISLA
jgi:6-phosphofructokinase